MTAEETFVSRAMFGCLACYVHGRLKLVLADRTRPWDGILVPSDREHHASLRRTIPALRVHPVLGKWLYLDARSEEFDAAAQRLVDLVLTDDPRIGVEPSTRRRKSRER